MKPVIVIPVFNEGQVIAAVVKGLQKKGFREIIIVDDGSTDSTWDQCRKLKVYLVHHSLNRGKGAAIQTGIQVAKLLNADTVVTFDGDGQHIADDIKRLLQQLRYHDVVIGSRFLKRNTIPLIRRFANILGNIITYLVCGIPVTDSQCGLRAYGKNALDSINLDTERYEYDSQVLAEIHRLRLRYIEVPVHVKYTQYSLHKSTKQGVSSGFATLFKLLVSS